MRSEQNISTRFFFWPRAAIFFFCVISYLPSLLIHSVEYKFVAFSTFFWFGCEFLVSCYFVRVRKLACLLMCVCMCEYFSRGQQTCDSYVYYNLVRSSVSFCCMNNWQRRHHLFLCNSREEYKIYSKYNCASGDEVGI